MDWHSDVALFVVQMALSEAEARQVAAQFAAARTCLDIVILGEADSVFPDAALDVLVQAANASSNSAGSADTPSPQPQARLVRFAAPDVALRETMPLWQQLEGLLEQLEAPARLRHEDSEGTCDSDGNGDGDGDDDGGHIDAVSRAKGYAWGGDWNALRVLGDSLGQAWCSVMRCC